MTDREEQERNLVTQQAADWFVANRAGLGDAERESFLAWLRASPTHVEEYLGVASTARELKAAGPSADFALEELILRARSEESGPVRQLWPYAGMAHPRSTRRWLAIAAGVAVFGLVGISAWLALTYRHSSTMVAQNQALHPDTEIAPPLEFSTRHGEQLTERLADGSVLHLNTDSAVSVHFTPMRRLVILQSGEASFEVTHEPRREFAVLAGVAEVIARGTMFDVHLENGTTVVTVIEGHVAVGRSGGPGGPRPGVRGGTGVLVQMGANEQLRVSADAQPAGPTEVDAQSSTAWLRHQIVFDHEPLEEVAAEFNRYSPTPIEIVTPALRRLRISGVFATDDTQGFIAFLRSLEGVRVEVTGKQIRVFGTHRADKDKE